MLTAYENAILAEVDRVQFASHYTLVMVNFFPVLLIPCYSIVFYIYASCLIETYSLYTNQTPFDDEVAYTLAHDITILICFCVMLLLLSVSFFSFDLVYRSKIMLGLMGVFFITVTARHVSLVPSSSNTQPFHYVIVPRLG